MSVECKGRIEVQRILAANISQALSFLKKTGWTVMEFASASFQKADKVVLMNYIGHNRVGWQAHTHAMDGNDLLRVDSWFEEQSWQIHCVCKRPTNTQAIEELPEDMASLLIAWFNGRGCEVFRKSGISNLRIDTDKIFVYNDNSNLYQKRAVFTVKIIVQKEMKAQDDGLDALLPKILPV